MIGKTVHGWSKELGKVGKEPNHLERHAGRKHRPEKKLAERVRKMAAKMKHEGYPSRFTSEKEQEIHD